MSLRRNFAWTLAGNVAYAACQWGILVAIAKLGTPTMLGQFALGLAVSAPVFMLTNLQLRVVLATDARHEYRLGHYITLRIWGTAAGLLLMAVFVSLAGFRRETALVVLFVSLAKAAETFSDLLYGFWQKHERFDKIAMALSGRGIGSLAAVAGVLYMTHSISKSAAAMALYWTVWLVFYERRIAMNLMDGAASGEQLRSEWDTQKCRQLVVLALPLGVVTLLVSLSANVPRYFIQHYLGEAALGYFAAMAYVLVAGNTVMAAMGQSASPRLARYFHADRPAYSRLLKNMVLLGAVLGLAGIGLALFFGRLFLRLLYHPEYAEYAPLFIWLMVAAALAYVSSMLGYGMTAARVFRAQVPLSLAATGITAVACWILIPPLGLTGAAYAVLIAAVFSCAASAYIVSAALRSPLSGL
ncbi:MAG TPA: oligosaccharide flippase family protein [Candidatus Acidoferrum sp.]|nr:oligosaccharide flippase family protein [Candidatus Acidoferrum sp.]